MNVAEMDPYQRARHAEQVAEAARVMASMTPEEVERGRRIEALPLPRLDGFVRDVFGP